MGVKTLTQFRAALTRIMGNKTFPPEALTSWINLGYQELCGGVDFKELQEIARATYPTGVLSVTLPSDIQSLRLVSNLTHEVGLLRAGAPDFLLKDPDLEGLPRFWSDVGKVLRLWPLPDTDIEIRIMYNRFPSPLVDDGDVTELTPVWDRAVELFAANFAFLDNNEEARANDWLGRAVTYVRTRLIDQEFEGEGPEMGVGVARSIHDLTDLAQ